MTLVGEKNCQEKKGFDLSKSRYLKIEDDFSGLVLFHDLEGNFVNGWRYTEGKVTRSVSALSFENAPQLKLKVAITNCITYDVYYWEQNCTDWWSVTYVDGAEVSRTYSRTTCGSQYMVYGGSYTECLTTGTTSGTYGGGGGGGTTTPQQSQTPTADKIIATNKNLTGDQMKLFENSLKQFINENCGSKAVYNALINNGFKVNIEMKGTLENSAAYNPVSGTLYFKNNDALQSSYA